MGFWEQLILKEVGMMVTDFDENNFGPLDTFEFWYHSFANQANKVSLMAWALLRLVNAVNGVFFDDDYEESNGASDTISDAIDKLLLGLFVIDGELCDCAKKLRMHARFVNPSISRLSCMKHLMLVRRWTRLTATMSFVVFLARPISSPSTALIFEKTSNATT
jgi:hypothetical protein